MDFNMGFLSQITEKSAKKVVVCKSENLMILIHLNRNQELSPPPPFGGTSPAKRGRDMRGLR